MSEKKTGIAARREAIANQHFPGLDLWTGEQEKGWFPVPRTLPLIMSLIRSKNICPKGDPSSVYLELLSCQRGEGVVELSHEADHAFRAGYESSRGVRTWQELMKVLDQNGFIEGSGSGLES